MPRTLVTRREQRYTSDFHVASYRIREEERGRVAEVSSINADDISCELILPR